MDKKAMTWLAVGILVGVVASSRLRALPVVKSLPTL